MFRRVEWRAALAMLPAVAGVGFSSGRALALFFGQLKEAAWPGIGFASAMFGLMVAGMAWRGAVRTGHQDKLEHAVETLRLLLAALVAAFMLYRLGRIGELTLPLRHGYVFGAALGFLTALSLLKVRCKWAFGLFILLYVGLFYAANALDPRPVRVYTASAVDFRLGGRLPTAMLLALFYASLNACAAGWSLDPHTNVGIRPHCLGLLSGGLLGGLLCLGQLALQRGGDPAMVHPAPLVVLSARWGIAGFWLCSGMGYICSATTLSSALGKLSDSACGRAAALFTSLCGLILFILLSWGRGQL